MQFRNVLEAGKALKGMNMKEIKGESLQPVQGLGGRPSVHPLVLRGSQRARKLWGKNLPSSCTRRLYPGVLDKRNSGWIPRERTTGLYGKGESWDFYRSRGLQGGNSQGPEPIGVGGSLVEKGKMGFLQVAVSLEPCCEETCFAEGSACCREGQCGSVGKEGRWRWPWSRERQQ